MEKKISGFEDASNTMPEETLHDKGNTQSFASSGDATLGLEFVKNYLSAQLDRLSELGETEFQPSRPENGRQIGQVDAIVYRVRRLALETSLSRVQSSLRSRILARLKISNRSIKIQTNGARLAYLPYWMAEGLYECYYLRKRNYKVNVAEDVVAVEIDGKQMDVISEAGRAQSPSFLSRIFPIRRGTSARHFVITDAVELAHIRKEAKICLGPLGSQPELVKSYPLWSDRAERIFDLKELELPDMEVAVVGLMHTKEQVIARLKDKIVKIPESFREILSNRFEIERLELYYVPFYVAPIVGGASTDEIVINGVTGKQVKGEIADLIRWRSCKCV